MAVTEARSSAGNARCKPTVVCISFGTDLKFRETAHFILSSCRAALLLAIEWSVFFPAVCCRKLIIFQARFVGHDGAKTWVEGSFWSALQSP